MKYSYHPLIKFITYLLTIQCLQIWRAVFKSLTGRICPPDRRFPMPGLAGRVVVLFRAIFLSVRAQVAPGRVPLTHSIVLLDRGGALRRETQVQI